MSHAPPSGRPEPHQLLRLVSAKASRPYATIDRGSEIFRVARLLSERGSGRCYLLVAPPAQPVNVSIEGRGARPWLISRLIAFSRRVAGRPQQRAVLRSEKHVTGRVDALNVTISKIAGRRRRRNVPPKTCSARAATTSPDAAVRCRPEGRPPSPPRRRLRTDIPRTRFHGQHDPSRSRAQKRSQRRWLAFSELITSTAACQHDICPARSPVRA